MGKILQRHKKELADLKQKVSEYHFILLGKEHQRIGYLTKKIEFMENGEWK